jgi:hypothetical protein
MKYEEDLMEPRVETIVDQESVHWIESEGAAMDAPYLRSAYLQALAQVRADQASQEIARLRRRTRPLALTGALTGSGVLAAGTVVLTKGPIVVGVLISFTLVLAGAAFAATLASIGQPGGPTRGLAGVHSRNREAPH